MTINASALERAIRRYWFRNPLFDGVRFVKLPRTAQLAICREAIEIEQEGTMSVCWGK